MPITSKRAYGPALLSASAATKYTVPSSTKAFLTQLHVSNNDTTTAYKLTLSIGTDAAGTRLFDAYPIPAASVYDFYYNIELDAAEIIQAFADTANKLNLTISVDEETL